MTLQIASRAMATGMLLLSIAGCGNDQGFAIDNAWGYVPIVPDGTAVAYLSVENHAREPLTITAFRSPDFGLVTLHETVHGRNMVHMQPLKVYEIAPGASLEMFPGGIHLMLMSPREEITPGHRSKLVIEFADGRSTDINLEFRDRASAPGTSRP